MSHEALVLEWDVPAWLAPILTVALRDGVTAPLERSIEEHRDVRCDPNDEAPLAPGCSSHLATGDVQKLADLALTKYYRIADEFGLGNAWRQISMGLAERQRRGRPISTGAIVESTRTRVLS